MTPAEPEPPARPPEDEPGTAAGAPTGSGAPGAGLGPAPLGGSDAPPADGLAEPAAQPPVVVVVVAHDPGDWFEATLRSIDEQTYENLAVLVIDAGSAQPVAARVAAVLPDAHERRLSTNPGFGPAANEVLKAVQGAAFYLLCHDDVRLEPDAVRLMVREAFRSNAGIVGPKLVRWDDDHRLLQLGMGADKLGQPAPMVEPGELDQSQHDGVREVFYVPGGVTLVRADLFAALGGFDPGIDLHNEGLDLCWRARVAGARTVVAPSARVGHLEALAFRHPADDRRRLQMRHRLRTVLVCYSPTSLVRVLPQGLLLTLVEVVYAVAIGRFRQARDVAGAWTWNARRAGELRRRRRAVAATRAVPDREVRAVQVRGSARVAGFLRGRLGQTDDRLGALAGGRRVAESLRSASVRSSLIAWAAVVAVLVVGSRQLITGGIPAVGDLAAFPDDAGALFGDWLRGYRAVGAGVAAPGPPALGLFGAVTTLLLGATGMARTVLVLAALPVGAAGAWRLARPIGSRRARIAALVVWVANPLAYNALARGRWGALVLCALAPWVLLQLARASRLSPYGDVGGPAGPGAPPRPLLHHVVGLGVLTALIGMWVPVAPLAVLAMAAAAAVGGLLVGQVAGAARMLAAAAGGAVAAALLLLPWSTSLLGAPADVWLGASLGDAPALDVSALLHFQTGPIGASAFGWALLLAPALALLIGRDWRLSFASRGWAVALASWSAVIVVDQGWLGDAVPVPVPELLLAPAVAGLALAAAMSMAAFEVDLPDYHFGWRQVASVLAAAGVLVGALPVLASAMGGRWDLPERDLDEKLAFTVEESAEAPFRLLWVGDPDVVPLAGWSLDLPALESEGAQLVYATSDGGPPDVSTLWTADPPAGTTRLADALAAAADGSTDRLGSLLAPMGVRYVVVPDRLAPGADDPQGAASPPLVDLLQRQLDLAPVPLGDGLLLFRNAAWVAERASLPEGTSVPADQDGVAAVPELEGATPVLPGRGVGAVSGPVPGPGELYVALQEDAGWELSVDGAEVPRRPALGWAMAYPVDAGGEAELAYRTPVGARALALAPVLLWVAAIAYLLRTRVARDERRSLDAGASAP